MVLSEITDRLPPFEIDLIIRIIESNVQTHLSDYLHNWEEYIANKIYMDIQPASQTDGHYYIDPEKDSKSIGKY